ncbi:hypothetical protein GCM10023258_12140 [Terrabacter aeriphilus]|uniref:Pimeloyl-ACP methyl ester carboxylesterase n=1 Tax=Terrabacter aeriphilus TaxID=515662 RepID=A0ABP9J8L6_9MICO
MRARSPRLEGTIDRDGVGVAYEVFDDTHDPGSPTVVFAPMSPVVHSRAWKAQVPYLSRYATVVTIDPRGNGRSDRPRDPAAYADRAYAADTLAVMDHLGIRSAALVGVCSSAWWSIVAAAEHPDRVDALVAIAPQVPHVTDPHPARALHAFDDVPPTDEGWAKDTAWYWRRDYRGYLDFFAGQVLPEPHSTKQRDDFVEWGLGADVEAQIAWKARPPATNTLEETLELVGRVRCPVLVIHGDDDRCQPAGRAVRLAELTHGRRVTVPGSGHLPMAREPVVVNLLMREFLTDAGVLGPSRPMAAHAPVSDVPVTAPAVRRGGRPPRALYLSSPIGLGHARRDLAVVRALRERVPGLEVDWLSQSPVTTFLEAHGERVHPASRWLANETSHLESVAGEHDLDAFAAIRDMDEILVHNFMVFSDLVEGEAYDLWTGDEAWEVDHFLHENPRLKRAPYAWLTDFVGWVPMPREDAATSAREAELTADYNAEMIEHVERLPGVRDRSLFVGNPDDVVDTTFGPGLPRVRNWVRTHYEFTGYITDVCPPSAAERDSWRAEFGIAPDDTACVVAVGGSGVGTALLRRAVEAHTLARHHVDGLRTILVTGPRIPPGSLPRVPGLTVRGFVRDLPRLLAAADVALVQGGLTTTMELAAAGRPFVYVPLRHHFEQNVHVRHRLDNYGAGRCLTWEEADPDRLAGALVEELGREVHHRPVERDGAVRAAEALAELVRAG